MRVQSQEEASKFDVGQFVFTWIAETLPVWIVSPIFVIAVKGFSKGISCCGHRSYLPLASYNFGTSAKPGVGAILKWLMGHIIFMVNQLSCFLFIYMFVYRQDTMEAACIRSVKGWEARVGKRGVVGARLSEVRSPHT